MDVKTDTSGESQANDALSNWFLLMDPGWRPAKPNDTPPIEAVVGVWPLEDGRVGKFRANPRYQQSDERSPSDPLDAVLRLVLQGSAEAEHIQLLLRDTLFDVAMNGDGRPLITKSPDDVLCVVVATGEPHRRRVRAPQWQRIDLDELVVLLADNVDVLFNPGGPASVRLTGDFMRETVMLDDEQVSVLQSQHLQDVSSLRIVPWDPFADVPEDAGNLPTDLAQ
ncbi:hypothetical protein LX90_009301 [Lentzea flava]|nr:hypothetical protein [Lentzea flava]